MKIRNNILVSFITSGMEVCWIYAWVSFTMTAIMGHAIAFQELIAIFACAAILTHASGGRGWRIMLLIGIHILGYSLAALYILHGLFYTSYPLLGAFWLNLFFTVSRSPLDWVHHIFILIWVGLIWFGGTSFAKRKMTYVAICARFDIGLATLFVLFLAKLVVRVKGGINAEDYTSSVLIYPYLLLSIIAIGIARVGHTGVRHFLPRYGGAGLLMSAVSIIVLSASSCIFLLLPILNKVAETGQHILKQGAFWVLPIVAGAVRFMFMGGRIRSDPPSGSPPKEGIGPQSLLGSSWWTELLEQIFQRGIEIIAGMLFAFAIALLMYMIFKWLFSRTAINPRAPVNNNDSLPWFTRLWIFLRTFWKTIQRLPRGYTRAAELFSVLSEWGKRSGIPRLLTDTPLEFGARLSAQFPKLKTEIEAIVHVFGIETYGEKKLTYDQFKRALIAWNILRSPVQWPRRIKTRLENAIIHKQE